MSATEELIQKIHDAPHLGVLAVSGAGSQAAAWILGVGGASRTILEVVVPYGRLSMINLVGFEPAQFVSEETAAYQRDYIVPKKSRETPKYVAY